MLARCKLVDGKIRRERTLLPASLLASVLYRRNKKLKISSMSALVLTSGQDVPPKTDEKTFDWFSRRCLPGGCCLGCFGSRRGACWQPSRSSSAAAPGHPLAQT